MNILILDKSIEGGTGTFITNFLKISKIIKGAKITILVLEKPSLRTVKNPQFIFFRPKNYYPKKHSLNILGVIHFIEEFFWVKKCMIIYKPDIVISVDLRSNFLAILTKIFSTRKMKVIATVHIKGTVFDKSYFYPFIKQIFRLLYDRADFLVCVSRQLSKSLKQDLGVSKRIATIYNGANFKPGGLKTLKAKRKNIIISVAQLSEQKDHINLIKAFKLLLKSLPSAELWILGDGPKRRELERFTEINNLTNKIKFYGWVKNVNSYLKKSDIFAFSSKREGFAYALIEAMGQGLPVVSTDTPYGPAEILGNGKFGILVPMGEPDVLKDAMLSLFTDKRKYIFYSRNSLNRSKYFSVDRMLNSYKEIIDKLYENRN